MAKVTIEIPDNQVKFIKVYQRWEGEKVNLEKYIIDHLGFGLGEDMEYMHMVAPRKLEKLVWDLELSDAFPCPGALCAQNPEARGVISASDEKELTDQAIKCGFIEPAAVPDAVESL
jgi:hypothetical protein